jgi:hypothetical protein
MIYDSSLYKITDNGDYYIIYDVIQGNYPEIYSEQRYSLHIIPGNNYFLLEQRLEASTFYEKNNDVGHAKPLGLWEVVGYSTDENNFSAKILEYYMNKKGDNILKKQAPIDTKEIFEINGEVYYLFEIYSAIEMNDDFCIWYQYYGGDYPNRFFTEWVWLHITYENNIYKLEVKYLSQTFFESCKFGIIEEVGHNESSGESYFIEYSNKNNLETKIFEYYLNNKEKIRKI